MKSPLTEAEIEVRWCGPGEVAPVPSIGLRADWFHVVEPDGVQYVASEAFCYSCHEGLFPLQALEDMLHKARRANEDGSKVVYMMPEDRGAYEDFGLGPEVGALEPYFVH